MSDPVQLTWGSGDLVIDPAPAFLDAVLSYQHKHLEYDPKRRDMVKRFETVPLFLAQPDHSRRLITYQGLLDRVVESCQAKQIPCAVADVRKPFPQPKLARMKGFRPGQTAMFLKLVCAGRSGLFKAPTRYGKTVIMTNVMRVFPHVKTVLAAPGVDLLGQLVSHLQQALPDREVRGIFTGSKNRVESEDITVVSLDSLDKVTPETTDLLLVDEPHTAATPARIPILSRFKNARIYGFGATTDGRFDQADLVITGLFGPVLARKTFQEAVKEGSICNIVAYIVKVPFRTFAARRRDDAYRELLYHNPRFNALVREISDRIIPANWQTFLFIDQVKQADLLQQFVQDGVVAVAQRMGKKERQAMFDRLVRREVFRCICTDIYSTGVTFPDIRCLINASGGGGSITSTQKPGRLAEIRPGKKCGYLIDFLFEDPERAAGEDRRNACDLVVADCWSRLKVYKQNGYEIRHVNRPEDIKLE